MSGDEERLEELRERWRASRYFQAGNRPQTHDEEHTSYVEAGGLRIGVETRALNPEVVREHLDSVGLTDNSGFGATTRTREFEDGGPSIHVFGAEDNVEYLRFDCFRDDPHYHYIVPGLGGVVKLGYDPIANGDTIPWVLSRLRERIPVMLRNAGADELAEQVDMDAVRKAVDQVEQLLAEAEQ